MISMVIEDSNKEIEINNLPHFTCYIKRSDGQITGQYQALSMNSWILDILSGKAKPDFPIYFDNDWTKWALSFINNHFGSNEKITLAGKNVASFDYNFLPLELKARFRHRMIDPGSMFIDWNNLFLPTMDNINQKLGLKPVKHNALDDARNVIQILRTTYPKKQK
jgi:hypothetical protein